MSLLGKRKFAEMSFVSPPESQEVRMVPRTRMAGRPKYRARTRGPTFEMKKKTYNIASTIGAANLNNIILSNVTRGSAINERNNNKIRVWRIEYRGILPGEMDAYILQAHQLADPVITDFGSTPGAFLDASVQNTKFTQWKHIQSTGQATTSSGRARCVLKFPKGLQVHYDGNLATDAIRNKLYFTLVNNSSATLSSSGSICMWFTDN